MWRQSMVSQINKIILKSLSSGDKYGLELIKDIQEMTNDRVILKQPSLYSALRRMEKKGLISSFWEDSELGGRRHYYSLTRSGREELQADGVVSESDIQSIIYEINKSWTNTQESDATTTEATPVTKTNIAYERFEPLDEYPQAKSFAQQIRKSADISTIQEKPSTIQKPEMPQNDAQKGETSFWRESVKNETLERNVSEENAFEFKLNDENKSNRFEINYKDILGDLNAEKSAETSLTNPKDTTDKTNIVHNSNAEQQRASEYSKQISQIFATSKAAPSSSTIITKEQEELRNAIFQRHNQSTLEEINRRYNINSTPQQQPAIQQNWRETDFENVTKVSPKDIELKQYVKDTNIVTPGKKEFLNINKLIVTRSIILTFFFVMAVLISYFVFGEQNFIYSPHTWLYWLALGAAVLYLAIMFCITLPNINKKVHIRKLHWFVKLFYRALISIALFTFAIALCLCFGMTNFMQIEFFTIWYLSALMVVGILFSWVLDCIIYSTKAFRE